MIYILLDETPQETFSVKGELFKYLIKVRRHSVGDVISFRSKENLQVLMNYELVQIESKNGFMQLQNTQEVVIESEKKLHIGWCVIDQKSVEKVLPSLNEIGVHKISFIMCERSQKNFKLDEQRLRRILESSMQQSGRTSYIEIDFVDSIYTFLNQYPETVVFDFVDAVLDEYSQVNRVLFGCEGGFSAKEKEFLQDKKVFRLNTPMVLRSESAVLAIASKILL